MCVRIAKYVALCILYQKDMRKSGNRLDAPPPTITHLLHWQFTFADCLLCDRWFLHWQASAVEVHSAVSDLLFWEMVFSNLGKAGTILQCHSASSTSQACSSTSTCTTSAASFLIFCVSTGTLRRSACSPVAKCCCCSLFFISSIIIY